MTILHLASKLVVAGALCVASALASAQATLPVLVDASGNDASIVIGDPLNPLADVTLAFQDATGLSPASLGVSVQQVSLSDASLLARLPDASLTALPAALPLLITIEPPADGGLRFRNTGRLEIHTLAHAVEQFAAGFGGVGGALINTGAGAGVGIVAGAIVLAAVMGVQKLRGAH